MKRRAKVLSTVLATAFIAGTMMSTAEAGPRRRAVQNYEAEQEVGDVLGGLALGAAAGAIASEQYYNDGYGYDYGYGNGYGYDYW